MAVFDDGKDAGALRTIGETAKATGIKPHVLRYWEQQFPMLKPLKRSGDRRYYRPEDIALIERIDALVNREGYTIKGARAALRDPAQDTAPPPMPEPTTEPAPIAPAASPAQVDPAIIERLKAIRAELKAALAA